LGTVKKEVENVKINLLEKGQNLANKEGIDEKAE